MNEKQCVRCGRAGHDSAECKWLSVAKALECCDWSGVPIGNKAIILQAIELLRTEQAQQAEPVAWQLGKRPPSVFKTSEAGRQYVADFFANALQRHDFSSYIKGHLAADFACALSDGLRAMQTAQPPAMAVPDGYALVPIEPTPKMLMAADRTEGPDADIYRAMLDAAQKGGA